MSSAWLEKCCCCISLRIGSFILGYLLMIIDFGLCILTAFNFLSFISLLIHFSQNLKTNAMVYVWITVAVVHFLAFILGIVLLVGLHTRKYGLLEKFYKIYPILMAAYYFIVIITLAMNGYYYNLKMWLMQSVDLALLLFQCYTLFVVFRRAKEMKREAGRDGVKLGPLGNTNVPNDQNNA